MTRKGYGRILSHARDVSQALGKKIARICEIAIGFVSLQGLNPISICDRGYLVPGTLARILPDGCCCLRPRQCQGMVPLWDRDHQGSGSTLARLCSILCQTMGNRGCFSAKLLPPKVEYESGFGATLITTGSIGSAWPSKIQLQPRGPACSALPACLWGGTCSLCVDAPQSHWPSTGGETPSCIQSQHPTCSVLAGDMHSWSRAADGDAPASPVLPTGTHPSAPFHTQCMEQVCGPGPTLHPGRKPGNPQEGRVALVTCRQPLLCPAMRGGHLPPTLCPHHHLLPAPKPPWLGQVLHK